MSVGDGRVEMLIGIGDDPVVEEPDQLQPVLQMVEHGLVEHAQQLALGQGQAIVGAAAEGRAPVAVDDQLRAGSATSSTTMPASRQAQ